MRTPTPIRPWKCMDPPSKGRRIPGVGFRVEGPRPIHLAWSQAPRTLKEVMAGRLREQERVIVGITGPGGGGKSTLGKMLSPCIVGTDSYLPDYEKVAYRERDRPHVADHARLAADLALLRLGQAAEVPVWSFQSHRRE